MVLRKYESNHTVPNVRVGAEADTLYNRRLFPNARIFATHILASCAANFLTCFSSSSNSALGSRCWKEKKAYVCEKADKSNPKKY